MEKRGDKRVNRRFLLILIIFVILVLIILLLNSCSKSKKDTANKESITISYDIGNKNSISTINLLVKSSEGIHQVILPNGETRDFKGEKEITIQYDAEKAGKYDFIVIDENGNREKKTVTVEEGKTNHAEETSQASIEAEKSESTVESSSEPESIEHKAKKLQEAKASTSVKSHISNTKSPTSELDNKLPELQTVSAKSTQSIKSNTLEVTSSSDSGTDSGNENGNTNNQSSGNQNNNQSENQEDNKPKADTSPKNINIVFTNNGNSTYQNLIQTAVNVSADSASDIGSTYYAWGTSADDGQKPQFTSNFTSGDILSLDSGNGDFYLWIKVIDSNNQIHYKVSDSFKLDTTSPVMNSISISYLDNRRYILNSALNTQLAVSGITDNYTEAGNLLYSITYKTGTGSNPDFIWSGYSADDYRSDSTVYVPTASIDALVFNIKAKDEAGNIAECEYPVSPDVKQITSLSAYQTSWYLDRNALMSDPLPFIDFNSSCSQLSYTVGEDSALVNKGIPGLVGNNMKICSATCPEGMVILGNQCVEKCPDNMEEHEGVCEEVTE